MDKIQFKTNFRKYFTYFLISFCVLFLFRLAYGYVYYSEEQVGEVPHINNMEQVQSFDLLRKNYASEKWSQSTTNASVHTQSAASKQKYEKIGTLSSKTNEFDKEEKNTRSLIKKFKALIQFEESSGLANNKVLKLGIGVDPEKFDEFITEIQKVGRLVSIQINKTDKTNEYKELNAERASLEKTIHALRSLKGKGGRIQELIDLENKILEIEQTIQQKGVKLGDFDEENEFCTVKFTLVEDGRVIQKGFLKNLLHRIKIAFEWSIKYYLYFSILIVFASVGILVFLLILERLRLIQEFFKKNTEEQIIPEQQVEKVTRPKRK